MKQIKKYSHIVTLQDGEGIEILKELLENNNLETHTKIFEYLQQWNYGESPIEEVPKSIENYTHWGIYDKLFEKDNFVMYYNFNLDYIGLMEIIE